MAIRILRMRIIMGRGGHRDSPLADLRIAFLPSVALACIHSHVRALECLETTQSGADIRTTRMYVTVPMIWKTTRFIPMIAVKSWSAAVRVSVNELRATSESRNSFFSSSNT